GLLLSSGVCMAQHHAGANKAKPKQGVSKFTTDLKTGVRYHFFKHNKTGSTPVDKDIATVIMVYRNDKDSIILDSRRSPNRRRDDTVGVVIVQLQKSFNGCLEQGIEMMATGDSAEFLINSDSLFRKTSHLNKLPPFIHSGTDLKFALKLVRFQTLQQVKEEQQQQMVKKQMENEKRKAEEAGTISKYLADNKLNVQPAQDSLYFLSRQN